MPQVFLAVTTDEEAVAALNVLSVSYTFFVKSLHCGRLLLHACDVAHVIRRDGDIHSHADRYQYHTIH